MSQLQASIIIINKNDQGVADTLRALVSMDVAISYEIIVIDASAGKLDNIRDAFPSVRWFAFAPASGSKKHIWIPEQRNMGVAKARGDNIVFIDANCIPGEKWLPTLLAPILSGEEQMVAGSTASRGGHTVHDQNAERRASQTYVPECPTINVAFTRVVWETVGAYDTRFAYGSDVDFSWRAVDAGFKIRYVPAAQIAHDWGDTRENYRRAYLYGVARARLYKKHPRRYKYLFTQDIIALIYPVYILGLPLTWWFWPYPLLILIPLLKNIRQQPLVVLQKHLIYAIGILRELFRL